MEDVVAQQDQKRGVPWRWVGMGMGVLGLFVGWRLLPLNDWLQTFSVWVGDLGTAGMVVYAVFYVLATVLFVPGAVITIGSGFLFGVVWGTAVVSFAATTGGALAFLISRYVARDWVVAKAERHEKFKVIDRAIGQQGGKIVFLLRLSPAIPFNLSNYLYGLTGVGFCPYVLASWLGMLPGTLLFVYLGAAGRTGLQAAAGMDRVQSSAEHGLFVVGLLATVAVTVLVTRIARKALKQTEVEAE